MARSLTSLHRNARVAHLGDPITACGVMFLGPRRATDTLPVDRRVCRACVRHAVDFRWLPPADAARLLDYTPDDPVQSTETAMIALLIDGCSDRQIAQRLNVSQRTLSRHIATAMSDADATSRF
jgi:DNA-binding NarL/FixJ family response regulator